MQSKKLLRRFFLVKQPGGFLVKKNELGSFLRAFNCAISSLNNDGGRDVACSSSGRGNCGTQLA